MFDNRIRAAAALARNVAGFYDPSEKIRLVLLDKDYPFLVRDQVFLHRAETNTGVVHR